MAQTFDAGNPQLVFEGRYVASQPSRTYDVSPDGQSLKRLVPTNR